MEGGKGSPSKQTGCGNAQGSENQAKPDTVGSEPQCNQGVELMNSFTMGDMATYHGNSVVLSEVRNKDVLLAHPDGKTESLTHSEVERAIETGELTVL